MATGRALPLGCRAREEARMKPLAAEGCPSQKVGRRHNPRVRLPIQATVGLQHTAMLQRRCDRAFWGKVRG